MVKIDMKKKLNIDIYRKTKHRQDFNKCVKYIGFIVLILIFLALIWIFFINQKIYSQDDSNFPITLSEDPVVGFEKNKTGFVVLTNQNLDFYSLSGLKLRSVGNTAISPSIDSCGDHTLLYEQGGTSYSIESNSQTIAKNIIDSKIMLAKVAENGNVALVVQDSRYICGLVVYDKSSNQIFKWNSAENIITDFCFTNNGQGCVALTMGAKGGYAKGTIYGLNFSRKDELFKTEIGNSMPIGVKVSGGSVCVNCDNKLVFMDDRGSIFKEIPHPDRLMKCVMAPNNYAVFVFCDELKEKTNLIVYDKLGSEVGNLKLDDKVKNIDSDGKNVVILTDDSIICCDMQLKILNNVENKQNVDKIICIDSFGYNIFSNRIHKFLLH